MYDITVTSEAVNNLLQMEEEIIKAFHRDMAAVTADPESTDYSAYKVYRNAYERMGQLVRSINIALDFARQVENGRLYADLDGVDFIGALHGGIVYHRDDHTVLVHT